MSDIILKYDEILMPGTMAQLSRVMIHRHRPKQLHRHDFYEMLWVQNGRVRHILSDDRDDLFENDMVLVQPQHRHAVQGVGDAPVVVSISLHPDVIDQFAAQFPHLRGRLFWAQSHTPIKVRFDSRQLAVINHAAIALEQSPRSTLDVMAFLAPICAQLIAKADFPPDAPAWLRDACIRAAEPAVFRHGAAGLVRETGKAHPHVSRTMRRFLGQTPAEFINDIRMQYAARALLGGSDTIADIAAEIGIPNLSHFHKVFRAYHAATPAQYRTDKQRHVLQPE